MTARRRRRGVLALGLLLPLIAGAVAQQRKPLDHQDPDGKPTNAAAAVNTPDGRANQPVLKDAGPTAAGSATAPATTPATGPARPSSPRKLLYYRNPMGLADTSPVPKKDSMGMDYIPVYADEGAEDDPPGTVRISPGKIQTLGVRTAVAAERADAARMVRATGVLQFDERRLAVITTKAAGWIEHLAVTAAGDHVAAGQVVAELYAPDIVAAEEEYLVAMGLGRAHAGGHGGPGGGDALTAAASRRLRTLDVPDDEITRLRRTGVAARRIAISAVRAGVVIDKPVREGMRVAAGETLYQTADLSVMWLIADVQERDFGQVRPGQAVEASFVAFPGRSFSGVVDFIYPALASDTRTARVRILIPNPDLVLRAAMYAAVRIAIPTGTGPVLTVPGSAVIDSGRRQLVLVAKGQGRFEPRPVRIGAKGDDWIEIAEGLTAGETVVVGANFLIDAESNLRAALAAFTAPPEATPTQDGPPGSSPTGHTSPGNNPPGNNPPGNNPAGNSPAGNGAIRNDKAKQP